MPKVSIIIVNWNTKDFLKDCLSSIQKGTGGLSYEVIVVDNSSSDDSIKFIEDNFPNIKLIMNSINTGFAGACNQGASSAMGEYLFFLNPDTILEEDSIKKLVEFTEKPISARLGAVGPQLLNRDGTIQNSVRRFPNLKDFLVRDTILKKLLPLKGKDRLIYNLSSQTPSIVDQISGAAILIRKSIWKNIGGMDSRFFMFYEEVDMCRRLMDLGYKVYYLPTATIVHLCGGARHKDRSAVFYYSVRSMFLYLDKYESTGKLFLFKLIYKPLFLIELLTGIRNKTKRDFLRKCMVDFIKF